MDDEREAHRPAPLLRYAGPTVTDTQPRIAELTLPRQQLWAGLRALTLQDLFPDVQAVVQRDPGLLVIAGTEQGRAALHPKDGLWLLEVENESCSVWRQKRWLHLSEGLTLNLIRAGNVLPQHLELVFVTPCSPGRHTVTAQYWSFGPDEWELVDWSYFSTRKMGQAHGRLRAAGIDADFREPFISFRFRLLPKAVDLTQMRLLAYCGTAYPLPGRRR